MVLITYIAPRRTLQLPCILNAYNLTPLAFCSLFKKPKTPPQHRGAIIRRQRKTGLSTFFKSFCKNAFHFCCSKYKTETGLSETAVASQKRQLIRAISMLSVFQSTLSCKRVRITKSSYICQDGFLRIDV